MTSIETVILAAVILTAGLFLVSFKINEIERDIRCSNIRIDNLRKRMNDLRKQLNRLTIEIINQKHEEN